MKVFRISVTVIFVIVFIAFCYTFYNVRSGLDNTVPKITIESEEISVSVDATDKQILAGVTAYDENDGDLTDRIIIQDISKFVSDSTSTVTYVVCDNNNHLARATRKIHYESYTSPRITLEQPLVFPISTSTISITSILGAYDVIDKDISSNIVVNSTNLDKTRDGIYTTSVSIFNSKGDRVTYDVPIKIYSVSHSPNCKINMKQYITYIKKGSEINPYDYVEGVYTNSGDAIDCELVTEGYINYSTPGVYGIYFQPSDDSGYFGITSLLVVVEE